MTSIISAENPSTMLSSMPTHNCDQDQQQNELRDQKKKLIKCVTCLSLSSISTLTIFTTALVSGWPGHSCSSDNCRVMANSMVIGGSSIATVFFGVMLVRTGIFLRKVKRSLWESICQQKQEEEQISQHLPSSV